MKYLVNCACYAYYDLVLESVVNNYNVGGYPIKETTVMQQLVMRELYRKIPKN